MTNQQSISAFPDSHVHTVSFASSFRSMAIRACITFLWVSNSSWFLSQDFPFFESELSDFEFESQLYKFESNLSNFNSKVFIFKSKFSCFKWCKYRNYIIPSKCLSTLRPTEISLQFMALCVFSAKHVNWKFSAVEGETAGRFS